MVTGRRFAGKKLPIILAFGVLVATAVGVGCTGFFQNPTLTSIAINPTAPQVDVGLTLQLQAFGTYDDGSRKPITSGVSWSSSDTTVATIGATTGILSGLTSGSTTITASAQALSGTASATVLLTNVTAINVNPTSGSIPAGGGSVTMAFTATANGVTGIPLTTDNGGILTINPNNVTDPPTCAASGDNEVCTGDSNVTGGTYTIVMTYPNSTASATYTLTVQ